MSATPKIENTMTTEENRENPTKQRKEVNLLLLGPTGAGKSTFINAIANYLTYGSLKEALQGDPVNLIPLQFEVTDEDYNPRKVMMGIQDDNEHLEEGKSATRAARTYRFDTADIILRCVDTPGIGDVEGKTQDKVNLELIMSHLNYMNEINGICIFMHPESARLTKYYKFCIDELLMHLHKDACKHIVFLFCKTRSNEYKPGDSLPTLRKLIEQQNYKEINLTKDIIYCMDNESVRLIAQHNNAIQFTEKEMDNCIASWDVSCQTIWRLISHVSSLPPHLIKNTVCLNAAKTMVYALIESILTVCENIQKNIDMLMKKRAEVAGLKDRDALNANFNLRILPKIILIPKTIKPRLVCASSKCVTEVLVDGVYIKNKDKVCHEDCYIPGLQWLNKFSTLNRLCKVMNEGVCTQCWCLWSVHKHITCEYEEKIVDHEADAPSKTRLEPCRTDVSRMEKFLSLLDKTVKMQEGERDAIIRITAKLGIFVMQNSIRSNSDVIIEQINLEIAFQDEVIKSGGSDAKKIYLTSLLQKYESQKTQSSRIKVCSKDVDLMKTTLFDLPLNGPTIESAVKATLNAYEQYSYTKEILLTCQKAISSFQKQLSSGIAYLKSPFTSIANKQLFLESS